MITSIEFTRRDDGLWEGQFPSGYGLLQVDRTKAADRNALHVYSQIEGMKPVRLATTTKNIFSMNLRLAPGMTVIILSEKPVDSCKFVSDANAAEGGAANDAVCAGALAALNERMNTFEGK